MKSDAFAKYLKRKGKKQNVIERNIATIEDFEVFLAQKRHHRLETADTSDIDAYVQTIESLKKSAKGSLYVLMNYFKFSEQTNLLDHSAQLRAQRTQKSRRIFPLKEFLDIDPTHIQKLAENGIKNVDQMLTAGKMAHQRKTLAKNLDIPEPAILELVKLSDLTRLGYVKAKLTRLYYNSGLDSPEKIAAYTPEDLHVFFKDYISRSGWDGMVPNPKDLIGNIASAKKLRPFVEY